MTISDTLTTTVRVDVAAGPRPMAGASREQARRQVLRAAVIRHPGLAEVTQVTLDDRGVIVDYAVPADASHAQSVPPLTGNDVIRLLTPVAAALALLHDAGYVHGAIGLDRLWLRESGGGLLGPGSGVGEAADDVRDLVAVLDAMVPHHSVGSDVAHLIVAGSDPDPALRPSMARIAAVLDAADRRVRPPMSPPAQRRSPMEPSDRSSSSGAPAQAVAVPSRGRHASPRGAAWPSRRAARAVRRRLSWRAFAVAIGVGVVALMGLNAVSGADTPAPCEVVAR